MQKQFISILISLVTSVGVFGQSEITLDQIISSSLTTENLPYDETINYLKSSSDDLLILDNIEVRTETREWDAKRQRYQARFSFNSIAEQNAYASLIDNQSSEFQLKNQRIVAQKKEAIYDEIIDLYFNESLIERYEEKLVFIDDQKKILDYKINQGDIVSLYDWYALENEINDINSQLTALREEKANSRSELNLGTMEINWSDFITISDISSFLGSETLNSPSIEDSIAIAIAQSEYEVEKAQANKIIKFAQVEYQGNNQFDFQEDFSLSASFLLPLGLSNRSRINETKVELLEEQTNRKIKLQERNEEVRKIRNDININLKVINQQIADQNKINLEEKISEIEKAGTSPISDLLKLKLLVLNNQIKILKLERIIYEDYLKLIYESEYILNTIDKNHLTS